MKITKGPLVKKLLEIEPKAETYELKKGFFYLVMVEAPRIISPMATEMAKEKARRLQNLFDVAGLKAVVMTVHNPEEVHFYEFEGDRG